MEDTIYLLRECDSGTKMAVASIDEVLKYTKGEKLTDILVKAKEKHETFGNRIHEYLTNLGAYDKEPNPMAKGMSWMKINMKMTMDKDDRTVANLIMEGCIMGIDSLKDYKEQYPEADEDAKRITDEIINTEKDMITNIKDFL